MVRLIRSLRSAVPTFGAAVGTADHALCSPSCLGRLCPPYGAARLGRQGRFFLKGRFRLEGSFFLERRSKTSNAPRRPRRPHAATSHRLGEPRNSTSRPL